MGITPWPGGKQDKAYVVLQGVHELSFLKLGSVLVGLSGGV